MSNVVWLRKPHRGVSLPEAMLWIAAFFWARFEKQQGLTPKQAEQLHAIIDQLVEPSGDAA